VKVIILIPAFNEAKVISSVITSIPKKLSGISSINVVVLNDGSNDDTASQAKAAGVQVISHSLNRGLGAAIKTGFTYAKDNKADILVTFDGDGQHDPADIVKIIKPIISKKADLVIGSRFKKKQKVPIDRFIINWLANMSTFVFYGVMSSDSQSGLRAFSKKALNLIDFKAERMEFSSEILLEAKRHKLTISEVGIAAIYTKYSREKGQKNSNAFPVFTRIIVRLLR